MLGVLRPITNKISVESIAEKLHELVSLPTVSPILAHFLPGVAERYSSTSSGEAALKRVIENPDITAYLLLLVNRGSVEPADITASEYPANDALDVGVEFEPTGSLTSTRLVGVASQIGGQSLGGLVKMLRPSTWHNGSNWTNLGIWYDPLLEPLVRQNLARKLTDHSPSDSFVTIEEDKTLDGKPICDPATAFIQKGLFRLLDIKPLENPMSLAHGIVTPKLTLTLVRKTSKASRR